MPREAEFSGSPRSATQKELRAFLGCSYHAFFTVLCDNLARDERYLVKHPYFFEKGQYFCWVNRDDIAPLKEWVDGLCARFLE
jgi:hypothetical protein